VHFTGFSPKALRLLKDLEANNHRDWYAENKAAMQAEVLGPFASMLEAASAKLAKNPLPLSGGKKTMFRMHRDVRFAKDKRPYKTHVGGLLTPTGKKIETGALVYAHLDTSGGFIATGFYRLPTRALGRIRDAILDDPDAFESIVSGLKRKKLELGFEDQLSGMPRGFAEAKDHPLAPYLRLKSFIVHGHVTKPMWRDGTIVDALVKLSKDCTPLLQFGRDALG